MIIYLVILHHLEEDYSPEVLGAFTTQPEALDFRNKYALAHWDIDGEDEEQLAYDLKQLSIENGYEELYVTKTKIDFGLKSKTTKKKGAKP